MKKIYFATKNKGKVYSVSNVLLKYGIKVVHYPLDLPEPRTDDLKAIAKEKILFAYQKIKKPCIVIDSGFFVPALSGFPKTYVNFVLETIGIEGILKLVEKKKRECEFRNCLAYLDESLSEPVYFQSSIKGLLSNFPRGKIKEHHWSKLFLIFVPKGFKKTLAEMDDKEYKIWSNKIHKNSYLGKFGKWTSKRG